PLLGRQRLLDRLEGAGRHRLTLVHAAAGYGKTTVLAQYADLLRASGRRTAWLTLQRGDEDPLVLFADLVGALRRDTAAFGAPHAPARRPPAVATRGVGARHLRGGARVHAVGGGRAAPSRVRSRLARARHRRDVLADRRLARRAAARRGVCERARLAAARRVP